MCDGKVSVMMGIYNCESTLPDALESLLSQSYDNWELILCDDASTDGTYVIAQEYASRYPERITLLRNEQHSFLAYSLNRCLEKASGEFVARMDGDDRSLPERFEKQVAFLREHPGVAIVGTAMRRFDDDGTLGAIVHSRNGLIVLRRIVQICFGTLPCLDGRKYLKPLVVIQCCRARSAVRILIYGSGF